MTEQEPSGENYVPGDAAGGPVEGVIGNEPEAIIPPVLIVPVEEPPTPEGLPKVLRTVIYLLGALGTVILFVDDGNISDPVVLGAKVAAGLAAITGFTYNPSFGVGARKK